MQNNEEVVTNENLVGNLASSESEVEHPRYRMAKVVGICPECGDSVFELIQSVSCFEALKGNCSFILDRSQFERHGMPEDGILDLLEDGVFEYDLCSTGMPVFYRAQLVRLEDRGWYVEFIGTIY
ncbi:hypothetical protein [Geobacter sp. SVR]|uniref:hypothetical protein n=1 Tax=Geobacter sp. SVR TaxID=2495594 RepID=UPI00143EFC67|nr:hypothetical protein [Geobacter sp. SVR]BCS55610.1 hypothetical protein GSVR_39180 [Geobacter sp. SVR]GCF83613.1 hypothetical protein GSbR_02130 [Geobacter sp. SVR]